jgi:hypothetical protein
MNMTEINVSMPIILKTLEGTQTNLNTMLFSASIGHKARSLVMTKEDAQARWIARIAMDGRNLSIILFTIKRNLVTMVRNVTRRTVPFTIQTLKGDKSR